ncbi:ParB/RepB/Spo0J family partition protein [soil metagenome]
MSAKSGLGRGFDSLIPQNFDDSLLVDTQDRVHRIGVEKLQPGNSQPRQLFDDEALRELATSVKEHGILQPLVVVAHGNSYKIIAGERRWRAAKIAKLTSVPAIVRTLKEIEQLEIALIENVQRVDLSALEQAVSIEKLHEQFNMTYEQIGKRLGKSVSALSNTVRLLQLPKSAQLALEQKRINEGHARAILALKDSPELQQQLLQAIETHGWSVRQAERFVTSVKAGIKDKKGTSARVATETVETKVLSKQLNAPVHLRRTAKGGKLEIAFTTDDQLNRILALLKR